eukprot:CAMPEP_0174251948 /NCGR_PEP_ID=MMETSP0439-20130205/1615_1 /TAXON_ID=0 /ORGANISM="Stereomyxa ramosa, Strain Chinc5" /LENGTH=476 /DNA_ID=CAMNT_0015332399 /DNA_START=1045 /DNA_END=2472 /DNA_ORIENTATION=+
MQKKKLFLNKSYGIPRSYKKHWKENKQSKAEDLEILGDGLPTNMDEVLRMASVNKMKASAADSDVKGTASNYRPGRSTIADPSTVRRKKKGKARMEEKWGKGVQEGEKHAGIEIGKQKSPREKTKEVECSLAGICQGALQLNPEDSGNRIGTSVNQNPELSPPTQRKLKKSYSDSDLRHLSDLSDDEEEHYRIQAAVQSHNAQVEMKGKIVVYGITGCGHCSEAKSILRQQQLLFDEVNLSLYPECVHDMVALTGKKTVPQIFFNNIHIGGLKELKRLTSESGEWERLIKEITENPPPEDTPQVPTYKAHLTRTSTLEIFDVSCEPDEYLDIIRRMRRPDGGLSIKNRMWHLRKYKNCFVGSEIVDWLMEKSEIEFLSREEALEFGNMLLSRHFFHHVVFDHPLRDGYYFYRFLQDEDQSSKTLNVTDSTMHNCEPREASEISVDLRKMTLAIYNKFLGNNGAAVDYSGISKSVVW